MRPISRRLFRILNNENFLPVELLDIRFLGTKSGSAIHLTSAGEEVVWDGLTYKPVNMGRGEYEDILSSEGGESPATTMNVQNVDGYMASILNEAELDGASATLRVCDRRLMDNPRDAVTVADGEIREPQITEQALTFQIVNVLGQLERVTVPRRLFQNECNYTFGSRSCGVALGDAPFTLIYAAEAGTTREMIAVPDAILAAAGNPDDPSDFWSAGYVLFKNGPCAAQARPIQRVDAAEGDGLARFHLRVPFLGVPNAGDTAIVRVGCRKTREDCQRWQGSFLQHGGFPDVPYGRFKPPIIGDL